MLRSEPGPRDHAEQVPFCWVANQEPTPLSLLPAPEGAALGRAFHSIPRAHSVTLRTQPQRLDAQHFHSANGPKDTNKDVNADNCLESKETNEERKCSL